MNDNRKFLTTSQTAERIGTTADQVVALIRSGLLEAINISTGHKPRWRVASTSLDAFIQARAHRMVQPHQRRRKADKPAVDYFA